MPPSAGDGGRLAVQLEVTEDLVTAAQPLPRFVPLSYCRRKTEPEGEACS